MFGKYTEGTRNSKPWVSSIFFSVLLKIASLLKMSFIVGSYCALFSATSLVMPLSGAFGGTFGALLTCIFAMGFKLMTGTIFSLHFLAYFVPGLCAALYFASHSWVIRVLVPAACMMFFIVHPIGHQVWYYSLYWMIPIALYFSRRNTLFLEALGSTFVAHAVGSVIWLYTMPMVPAMWLALIPVVFVERILFAVGMVCLHHVFSFCKDGWSRIGIASLKKMVVFAR